METFTVEGKIREGRGKGPARQMRLTGMVPATMYGGKKEAVSLAVNAKQVARILRSETGHNTIFSVKLEGGGEERAMLKDWQVDPLRGALLHVDLLRIAMDVRMRVRVPVHTFGEPQGVKMQGGVFETVTREVEVECLPGDIPEEFRMDVSEMLIGKQLRAGDLPIDGEKVKLLTDPAARARARRHAQEGRRADAGSSGGGGSSARGARSHQEGQEGNRRGRSEGAAEQLPRPRSRKRRSSARRGTAVRRVGPYETDRWPRQSRPGIRVDAAQHGLPGDRRLGGPRGNSGHAPGGEVAGGARPRSPGMKWFWPSRRR